MRYTVNIKENKTNNIVKTVLETESDYEAYSVVNQYNKEYGEYSELLKEYPKKSYNIEISK